MAAGEESTKMPYLFEEWQLTTLARIAGNAIENGDHRFDAINDEVGVAHARRLSSSVRKVRSFFGGKNSVFVYLSESELELIASHPATPPEILEVLGK